MVDRGSRRQDHGACDDDGETDQDQELRAFDADQAGHRADRQGGEGHEMHGSDDVAEAAGEHAGNEKQLEDVRRQFMGVEQEGDCRDDLAEGEHQACEQERGIVRPGDPGAIEPGGEGHEDQRQDLAQVREGVGDRDHEIRLGAHAFALVLFRELPDAFRQHGNDDEEALDNQHREERVLRDREDLPIGEGRADGDQHRQRPKGHKDRAEGENQQIGLQPFELLEAQRPGGGGRDGQNADRGEFGDELVDPQQCRHDRIEVLEEVLLALDADQGDAEHDAEHDDRRRHVVGQRAEGVARDEELNEVDARL